MSGYQLTYIVGCGVQEEVVAEGCAITNELSNKQI